MNEKHAREARIVNRVAGNLVKKDLIPTDERGVVMLGNAPGRRHKVPRAVKRNWARLNHRERARVSIYWRSGVAYSLKARGITPKGERVGGAPRKSVKPQQLPRSQRGRCAQRELNYLATRSAEWEKRIREERIAAAFGNS